MRRRKLALLLFALFLLFAGAVVYLELLLSGPRMVDQPKILSYRELLPALPEGSLPAAVLAPVAPPRSPDPARGKIYYGYYCKFCHGTCRTTGPVGMSYVPRPRDLGLPLPPRTKPLALIDAMIQGTGHEPVLGYVVPEHCLPDLAAYVSSLPELCAREGAAAEE